MDSQLLNYPLRVLVISNEITNTEALTNASKKLGLSEIYFDFCQSLDSAFKELYQKSYCVVLISVRSLYVISLEKCIELNSFKLPVIVFGSGKDSGMFSNLKKIGFDCHIMAEELNANFYIQLLERICSKAIKHNQVQKEVVKKLALDNHLTRKTLDNAPIGVVKLGSDLKIIEVNATIARLLNVNRDDLGKFIGRPVLKIFSGLNSSLFTNALNGEKEHFENYELVIDSFNPSCRYWDIAIWPIVNAENQIANIMMLISDITEKMLLAKQREDIIATLAHDLKTPLIGAQRTLESIVAGSLGSLNKDQAMVLSKLKQSNHNLLSMIKNIVDVNRYDSPDLSINFNFELLSNVVESCINDLATMVEEKNLIVKFNKLETETKIAIDRYSIYRAIFNLLDNAIKFSKPNSFIIITHTCNEAYSSLTVQDFGCGLEIDDNLFKRFHQGYAGKRTLIGSGLGLYLTKQIIDLHHGQININSQIDSGSSFTILLPLPIQNGKETKLLSL